MVPYYQMQTDLCIVHRLKKKSLTTFRQQIAAPIKYAETRMWSGFTPAQLIGQHRGGQWPDHKSLRTQLMASSLSFGRERQHAPATTLT